jgi:hypothetical protein
MSSGRFSRRTARTLSNIGKVRVRHRFTILGACFAARSALLGLELGTVSAEPLSRAY